MPTMPRLDELMQLVDLVTARPGLVVRWSAGPGPDDEETSCDPASGLELPGLAVNPLSPPRWWTLSARDWIARQVRAYAHLGEDQPDHIAWVLAGRIIDRGPDNEPLVVDVEPVAELGRALLDEAEQHEPHSPRPQDQDTSWRSS
jgi:Family of unknown function (DUF6098)